MNDAIPVAWVGVALTIVVQVMALAFFFGRQSSKIDAVKRDFDSHIELPVPRAHGCPYFTPEQH